MPEALAYKPPINGGMDKDEEVDHPMFGLIASDLVIDCAIACRLRLGSYKE